MKHLAVILISATLCPSETLQELRSTPHNLHANLFLRTEGILSTRTTVGVIVKFDHPVDDETQRETKMLFSQVCTDVFTASPFSTTLQPEIKPDQLVFKRENLVSLLLKKAGVSGTRYERIVYIVDFWFDQSKTMLMAKTVWVGTVSHASEGTYTDDPAVSSAYDDAVARGMSAITDRMNPKNHSTLSPSPHRR